MGKLWTDINTLVNHSRGFCPLFATNDRYPAGIPVVTRISGGTVEVMTDTDREEPWQPYTCDLKDDEDGNCRLYVVLPASITRAGICRVFGDSPCGALVHKLAGMADLLFDEDNREELFCEAIPVLAELARLLRSLVPGSEDCREVAALEAHVSDAMIRSALTISNNNAEHAATSIMANLERDGWICAFDRQALVRRIADLRWQNAQACWQ